MGGSRTAPSSRPGVSPAGKAMCEPRGNGRSSSLCNWPSLTKTKGFVRSAPTGVVRIFVIVEGIGSVIRLLSIRRERRARCSSS